MQNLAEGKKLELDWWTRMLFILSPFRALCRVAEKMGVSPDIAMMAHDLFVDVKCVEIARTASDQRGFILTINRNTALYFYQDGDHFAYDGFEMGTYDPGDVQVFDRIEL